ncbi:YdeI/OmpD-associated family protein [Bacillus sp. OK048]|uniref:YdeI/OmpD-associated family protein n=1 Tax=Bacillus sp. OK048 TaxID=1882761 RepID=UPI00088F4039|nr:YdeI/OmpD-associated family protein [Bacillus sp. OK048]SDM89325.1 Bacteriocin-protection, YdeI or OmpD-Associated [Bacillus sp. OK048]
MEVNSTKSVIEKLNFSKYPAKLILNMPVDVEEFKSIEYDTTINNDQYDLIFTFIFQLEDFVTNLREVVEKQLVKDNGYIYFAYPKKNNPKYKEYIERDSIYTEKHYDEEGFFRGSNLKFSRMVSFNEVFTVIGLKAIPVKKKTTTKSTKNSQCVDDYIQNVEDIKQYLQKSETLLNIYNELTPGYQKDWARYVYSAKRKETQEKRLLEMETVLTEGYKTMDLYRRAKK